MIYRCKSVAKMTACVLVSLLLGCQTQSRTPAEAELLGQPLEAAIQNRPLEKPQRPQVVYLNSEQSLIQLFVYRAGRLAHLGHNHLISAPVKGVVRLHPNIEQTAFELILNVTEFTVDDATARAKAGGDFASPITAQAKIDTRKNMLGKELLDAENFPYIEIYSLSVEGEFSQIEAVFAVTLKGVTQALKSTIEVTREGADYIASGSLVISQQQFDLKPYSILGGAIAVADEIIVRYHLVIPAGDSVS